MNKRLWLYAATCFVLLTGGLVQAQEIPAIYSMEQCVTTDTPKISHLKITYPQVIVSENKIAGQKISQYFAADAARIERNFRSDQEKNVKEVEEQSYEVTLNDGKYLSILHNGYVYYDRAAHPMSWKVGITFDVSTGKKVRWQSLIRQADMADFTLEQINKKLWASEYGQKNYFYRDFYGLTRLPENYYLDAQRQIHFIFGQYEIAPYSTGIIDLNMQKTVK